MRTNHESQAFGFLIAAAVLTAASLYFYTFAGAPKTAGVLIAFSVASFLAALIEGPRRSPLLIDEHGLYDERLGIGKIFWNEVRDFYVEETHGNRFLCLQVQRPERFMIHADRSQKARMALHHSIGFRRINVDVKHLNLSVQELHKRVENRIQRTTHMAQ